MREPIRIKKGNWLKEVSMTHIWVVWCKSKKGAQEIQSSELSGKEIFSNCDKTKSKEVEKKKNRSKKSACCGHGIRYRSWWKQGHIKIRKTRDRDRRFYGITLE